MNEIVEKQKEERKHFCSLVLLIEILQGKSEPTKTDKVADRRRKVATLAPDNAPLLCWDNVACRRSLFTAAAGIVMMKFMATL